MLTEPRGSSLAALADAADERFGTESVLLFEGIEHSHAQIAERARRFATGLASLGVGRGDRVAVCMANCPEVLETYRAVWRLGAAVTPLLFLLSPAEIHHALGDSGAKAIITTPEFLPAVTEAASGLEVRVVVVGDAPDGADGAVAFDDLASGVEASRTDAEPSEMAALLYTGGTTGRSKGVVLSHDALSTAAWNAVRAGEQGNEPADELTVSLLPLPLAHSYGILVSTMALHATQAGRTVLMRWFDPAGWLQLAEQERVQQSALVPTMLRMLADQPAPGLADHDLSALRRVVSGSAPLPAEIADHWARVLPDCEVVEGYGCSETAALATSTPRGRARRGSVGLAAPEVTLRVLRPDGSDADPGEDGEIVIDSPSVMTEYWHDPETTAQAVPDGAFHTGDVGHLDDDGYLFVVDRLKDVILRGGFNVYPRDVEEVLMTHPAVANCAVVGRPDQAHGEEVVAFVQLHPGTPATPEELIAWSRARLSRVKYPREVHVLDQVPVTSVGKLDRKALRALVHDGADGTLGP